MPKQLPNSLQHHKEGQGRILSYHSSKIKTRQTESTQQKGCSGRRVVLVQPGVSFLVVYSSNLLDNKNSFLFAGKEKV